MQKKLLLIAAILCFSTAALAQNVGIGTTTPTTTLEVIGKSKTDSLYVTGNVGIGINNPNMTMMIRNNLTAPNSNILSLGNGLGADPNFGLDVRKGIGDVMVQLGLQYSGSIPNSSIRFHRGGSNNDGFMSFTTNADVERMRIDASGNIGIGTITPTSKLQVIGKTTTDMLQITTGATNGYFLKSDALGNTSWANVNLSVSETDPKVGTLTTNKYPKWNSTSLTDGIIYDNGIYIGIGTTTPTNNLDVLGATGFKSSSTGTWIAGNFGDGGATNDRVVMGYYNGLATIGAHNSSLSAWANLSINPGGGNVGIGTATINPSSKVEISSTTQGFLPPRMTLAQRDAIGTPAQGLMIYCTNCGAAGGEPEYYNGNAWVSMGGSPAAVIAIGNPYQGGIIAYILQSGDPGYIAGQVHGLIAAPSDQSTGIQWYNGSNTATGATATALGTGNANTNTIVAAQGAGSYAAKLCYDLVLNGYSDWYLPSKDELDKLYLNRIAIGNFTIENYWNSSEFSNVNAWNQYFFNGLQYNFNKVATDYVRAVRAF